MIKALLWDMDGVFVDTEDIHFRSWQWMVKHAGATPLTLEEYTPCVGHSGWENVERIAKIKGITGDLEELRILRRQKFEEMREKGVPLIEENITLVKNFKTSYPHLRQIIVSSASKADINRNLHITGLEDFFEMVVSYEEKGGLPRKPAPDIYLYTLEESGLKANECIAFEDTESGITSAKTAGIFSVALPNQLTAKQNFSTADLIIPFGSMKDPKMILEQFD